MKNACFTLLLTAIAFGAAAQKITVKKNLVTVDGRPYARIEPAGEQVFGVSDMYYVSSLQNERLFAVKALQFNDPASASPANPTGSTNYVQFIFTASRQYIETPMPLSGFRMINVARIIYAARLFKNDALDPQAIADFSVNNGTPYSARRAALDHVPVGY